MVTQAGIFQEDLAVLVILVDISQEDLVVLVVLVALVDIFQEVQVVILVAHLPVALIHHLEEDLLQDTTQQVDQDQPCLHPRHFV